MKSRLLSSLLAVLVSQAPAVSAEPVTGETPIVVRLTTSVGDIDIRLLPAQAPRTVENFLKLVDEGFYEGLIFHRVLANFVIQAGGYDAELNYQKPPGTVVNESLNGLRNKRGTVAMARLSDPDSADAQFFINVNDNTHLDAVAGRPGYTVFGETTVGMEVVTAIELSAIHSRKGMAGVPEKPIIIQAASRLSAEN